MIVATSELPGHAGAVAMVDGGFDPLHAGHVDYFREAAGLGTPVLCNVSSDDWVGRKHPPLLSQADRVRVIDSIRWISFTHASAVPTVEVLSRLRPRYYVKGADWRDRLPADELAACAAGGVEVVFLETVTESSSAILERWRAKAAESAR